MAKHSLIDKIVYKITKKPTHYKDVKHPPKSAIEKLFRPQDARQVQYNNWSKSHKVYSGSYLPTDGNKRLKQGWNNENNKVITNNKPSNPSNFYRRKSTNQWVRNDKEKNDAHWHWYNLQSKEPMPKSFTKKNPTPYLDQYVKPCKRNSKESHIQGE